MKRNLILILVLILGAFACNIPVINAPGASPSQTATDLAWTLTPSLTITPTLLLTNTLTPTLTGTTTLTPTITWTPSITLTPTYEFPAVVVNKQAHCRYGPNIAYLHAADLYTGDAGTVRGRSNKSNWLFIKFDKLNYFCWVAPSVVDVTGNIDGIYYTEPVLPGPSIYYRAPNNVVVTRKKNKVTITWDRVEMTKDKDRGYFLDLIVCQNKLNLWWPVSFDDQYTTSYTVVDEKGCPEPSGGKIYTVEKHGYSTPKTITGWPKQP